MNMMPCAMKRTITRGTSLLAAFMLVALFLSARADARGPANSITVSAAISLKDAFLEIGRAFEAENRGVKVFFNFGASGDLAQQIEEGAPVDVFASADKKDMDEIEKAGFVLPGSRGVFAKNIVVLIVPSGTNTGIGSFKGLAAGRAGKIAIGDPRTVPAGRYAKEVFQYYGIFDALRNKLVFAANVRQVLDYVARGEVDAGVVYLTDADIEAKDVKVIARAPEASHKPMTYPIAVVKGTKNEALAGAFVSAVRSGEGRRILERYGFITR